MEEGMVKMALSWGLDRLNEKSTWIGLISALGGKLGVHFTPEFDTLTINIALSLVALVAYAVKGGPVVISHKK